MPSPGSTHDRMTSGVACHHRLWAAQTVERRQALHPIIAIELAHTVGWCRPWHANIAPGQQTQSNDVGLGMPSSPLGSTDSQTASGVACHHRLSTANTVERRRAWHAIITFMQHKRSNDVERGMPSIAFRQHKWSNDVGHGMKSPLLDYTHRRMT